jgi:hypothetical protein
LQDYQCWPFSDDAMVVVDTQHVSVTSHHQLQSLPFDLKNDWNRLAGLVSTGPSFSILILLSRAWKEWPDLKLSLCSYISIVEPLDLTDDTYP